MKSFRIMMIKMKIAHGALTAGQPILDFFLNAIIKTLIDHCIPKEGIRAALDDNKYFSWRALFFGDKIQ
jgi:hypothetical protein